MKKPVPAQKKGCLHVQLIFFFFVAKHTITLRYKCCFHMSACQRASASKVIWLTALFERFVRLGLCLHDDNVGKNRNVFSLVFKKSFMFTWQQFQNYPHLYIHKIDLIYCATYTRPVFGTVTLLVNSTCDNLPVCGRCVSTFGCNLKWFYTFLIYR